MVSVRALQTGRVKVKPSFMRARGGALSQAFRVLFGRQWSEWLPIYAWIIEHPEGCFLVDTGETTRVSERGYLPLIARSTTRFDVKPQDEIGSRLSEFGIQPDDVTHVILTHLHSDHSGGLSHFRHSDIFVDPAEHEAAKGRGGRTTGYPSHMWPSWFNPKPLRFEAAPLGPFSRSCTMTKDGVIAVVPTPGHTPGHVAVIVKLDDVNVVFGGDLTFDTHTLVQGIVFGMANDQARQTLQNVNVFARERPTVYLGSHDPDAPRRLASRQVVY